MQNSAKEKFSLRRYLETHFNICFVLMCLSGFFMAWQAYVWLPPVFQTLEFILQGKTSVNIFSWVIAAVFGILGVISYLLFKVCEKVLVEGLLK